MALSTKPVKPGVRWLKAGAVVAAVILLGALGLSSLTSDQGTPNDIPPDVVPSQGEGE
ncbi:hypothetical protein NBRC116594_36260 [Shimia sp. NS0008-38b]|uniref:hypothetical protein n=1 Tax=Shimia sp. NS0008-38b TaxID=3127653 RepID=UPI003107B555